MSRGALVVFASSLAVAGCGATTVTGTTDAAVSDAAGGGDGAATDASTSTDAASDSGTPMPAYGLPAPDSGPVDTGSSGDGSMDGDAKDGGGGVPLYGLPPPFDAGPSD